MSISRRNLLKGVGVAGLGLAVGGGLALPTARRVLAQENAAPTPSAFYQIPLGDAQATIIQDGAAPFNPDVFGTNQPEGAVVEFLEENNLTVESLKSTFNILLLTNGDRRTLIDTGLSAAAGGGRLIPTLGALGIAPEDITDVVISHFHPDHINGVSVDGAIAFPNATHYIAQAEWDFLQSVPSDSPIAEIVSGALAKLQPVVDADQLQYYNSEDEVVPGIQALATPGHTPGHHAFLIGGGSSPLLHFVDAVAQNIISVQNPDWYFGFDADPDLAIETRLALLNRAADEKLGVFGYHFAFPGIGYIDREGEGFRYLATS
jgi:glyoxylase-like metal-dependent hydrolase (beta-lactamase superfamily II)